MILQSKDIINNIDEMKVLCLDFKILTVFSSKMKLLVLHSAFAFTIFIIKNKKFFSKIKVNFKIVVKFWLP